ncbi:hypothetical protein [Amycolatopsis sp. H20-H5]|uniref:hypothetical protein n=1 Tax=Amycolatopsis sp. H20-H5 TaxID=3046309 RepID=UPI003FA3D239
MTGVVNTVGQTILPAPVPAPEDYVPQPTILPLLGDVLDPVFDGSSGGGISGGGTVTVTVPGLEGRTPVAVTALAPVIADAPPPAAPAAPASVVAEIQTVRAPAAVTRPVRQPVKQDRPQNSATHANNSDNNGGGSGGGGGLPSAPSAPAGPTTTANAGHDGSGGARQPFAVLGSTSNTTQLKLIGVSRDHEVDGVGREAALPTTSPD